MNNSKTCFLPDYSHIYVEEEARTYELTTNILTKFINSQHISIRHYKDIFCRRGQDFEVQKKSMKLILAVKREPFFYKGPKICHDFGEENFYYTSPALNCIYHCDYCFLQGMYSSCAIVIFVNICDYFENLDQRLKESDIFLTTSYDTDLLALESIAPITAPWIEYARQNSQIIIEIRTKSCGFDKISYIEPAPNVRLGFTLSPSEVVSRYEKGTPTLNARLKSIKKALLLGWKVRLCFDPLLWIEDFEKTYKTFVQTVFSEIDPNSIEDVSVGVFRIPADYLKNIRKIRKDTDAISYPYEIKNSIASYPKEVEQYMKDTFIKLLKNYLKEEKIFL